MIRIFLLSLITFFVAIPTGHSEIIFNGIVASVDGVPLTVSDISKRLGRQVSLAQCASDPEARQVVDKMINEMLIESEAQSKRITVSKEDVEGYINEVAARNNLSREQFETALTNQKKNISEYREEIKTEILKARLVSTYIQGSTGVSDAEIEAFLEQNSSVNRKSGAKVTLRQIVILKEKNGDDQAKAKLVEAKRRLDEGDDFEDLASEVSDGAEASDGGLLGTVSMNDLSTEIFNAVLNLNNGEISEMTESPIGYHLFYIEDKEEAGKDEALKFTVEEKNSARKFLEQAKFQEKSDRFFSEELYKTHSIDKKI